MFRATLVAVVAFGFAGAAAADCGASHGAQRVITDDQAKATEPAVKKAAQHFVKQKAVACEGTCPDKNQHPAQAAVALARSTPPASDKPSQ